MRQEEAYRIVKDIADGWSKVYINQVFPTEVINNIFQ